MKREIVVTTTQSMQRWEFSVFFTLGLLLGFGFGVMTTVLFS